MHQEICIPNYPDKVEIAKVRRIRPYVNATSKIKGSKYIPIRYRTAEYTFDSKGRLCDSKGDLVLSNPRTAGKPRYWVVNFQSIWNQAISKQSRNTIVNKLKDILRPYIDKFKVVKKFPVEIAIHIFDVECPVDISNRGAMYTKVIEDLLVSLGKLPDDSVEYVNCSGRTKFWKIDDVKDKKMIVTISTDSRAEPKLQGSKGHK